jgi:hypothetical protein
VAQQFDCPIQRVYGAVPPRLEILDVPDQDFLSARTIRIANLLLLSRQQEVEIFGRTVALPQDRGVRRPKNSS